MSWSEHKEYMAEIERLNKELSDLQNRYAAEHQHREHWATKADALRIYAGALTEAAQNMLDMIRGSDFDGLSWSDYLGDEGAKVLSALASAVASNPLPTGTKPMADHKQGCPALGGYGTDDRACICGYEIDKETLTLPNDCVAAPFNGMKCYNGSECVTGACPEPCKHVPLEQFPIDKEEQPTIYGGTFLYDHATQETHRLYPQPPEGWKLVPLEATDDMVANIRRRQLRIRETLGIDPVPDDKWAYAAMVMAAPQPPGAEGPDAEYLTKWTTHPDGSPCVHEWGPDQFCEKCGIARAFLERHHASTSKPCPNNPANSPDGRRCQGCDCEFQTSKDA
jgi:hypothetical protein